MARVRCIASPDPRASAVGTLELECTPDGLHLVYLGLSAYRPGYAPGPPATGSLRAPWAGVRVQKVGERQLLLELDPALGPHRRLLLTRFRPGSAGNALEQGRRRLLLFAGASALALLLAVACGSPSTSTWPRAAVALAAVVAAAFLVLLAGFSRRSSSLVSEPDDDAFHELTEALSRHVPELSPQAPPPEPAAQEPFWSPARLEQRLPRTAVGMAIAIGACGLATILTSIWLLRAPARALPPAQRTASVAAPAPGTALLAALPAEPTSSTTDEPPPLAEGDGLQLGAPCACARPASILWDGGVPRLSTIVSGRSDGWENNRPHLRFDLHVINNGDRALERLSLRVVFRDESRKNPSGQRVVGEQYFFDAGPLAPGKALSWRVSGEGSSFEVLAPDLGMLDEHGKHAAPADSFDRLARDRHRAVRLHASMMLGFLGDERARRHALELRAEGRELEGPYLERVLAALAPLRVCEVLASSAGEHSHTIECCLQNVGDRPEATLGLRVRGVDGRGDVQSPLTPPPLVFAESGYRVAGELSPRTGRTVELVFESAPSSPSPLLFEYLVESGDELR